jgi:hypothetical protein
MTAPSPRPLLPSSGLDSEANGRRGEGRSARPPRADRERRLLASGCSRWRVTTCTSTIANSFRCAGCLSQPAQTNTSDPNPPTGSPPPQTTPHFPAIHFRPGHTSARTTAITSRRRRRRNRKSRSALLQDATQTEDRRLAPRVLHVPSAAPRATPGPTNASTPTPPPSANKFPAKPPHTSRWRVRAVALRTAAEIRSNPIYSFAEGRAGTPTEPPAPQSVPD